ncbi:MAG: hypothetical protein ABSF89_00980 [Acidimicrobiales bacterium]|jgi:hypothetical protein
MLLRTKRFALVGAALSAAGAVGVLTLGTATATPIDTSHVLHFIAVRTAMSTLTETGAYYESDVEVASGSPVGQEVASCVSATTGATCYGAFANASGIIDAHFTVDIGTGTWTGTVTGGTGTYADVSGMVNGTRVYAGEAVTIVYSRFLPPPPPITVPTLPPISVPTLPTVTVAS